MHKSREEKNGFRGIPPETPGKGALRLCTLG